MQTTLALAALVAVAAAAVPSAPAPAGCSADFAGQFEITAINSTIVTTKRSIVKRTCGATGSLTLSLAGGILTDAQGRIGSIVSNFQFQFDGPPAQAGAIFDGGFSACSNGSLALGGSAVFFECLSGSFFNLYDQAIGAQCEPILIEILPCSTTADPVGQNGDGQATGTSVGPAVTQITDGQPQAQSAIPITQISDGQPQIPSSLISQIAVPVTQITDGQPQAPTATVAPVTQISDGQPQVPTATPVAPITQISDGQPQVPTATAVAPITQISDGQPQVPTATTVAPITQISDGQPQVPTAAPAPISQISDGQPQAPNATLPVVSSTPTPSAVLSGGNVIGVGSSLAAAIAGLGAILLL